MIDPNVIAALITGIFAVILFTLGQFYRARNRQTPPETPLPPTTSSEMWGHITGLSGDVADLKAALRDEKNERESFTGAVRRYLELLARSWGKTDVMPYPEGDDFDILQITLPRGKAPRRHL